MAVLHFYSTPPEEESTVACNNLPGILETTWEFCYNVEVNGELSSKDVAKLKWIICDPLKPSSVDSVREESILKAESNEEFVFEIGPRLNFSTPFSSNAVSISHSIGLKQIKRIEKSIRCHVRTKNLNQLELSVLIQKFPDAFYDRMTSCLYQTPITSFDHGIKPEPWYIVDILKEGRKALEEINQKLGLSFDEWDLNFYTELFMKTLQRNPTSVECFDLAQSNSEHSRHWFFRGTLNIDGNDAPCTLFDMIKDTQKHSNPNNVIKFSDNSSAIEGFSVHTIRPKITTEPTSFHTVQVNYDLIFTAETHNFPTAICPFSGAATGTGGRIRDVQAVGRGGHTIAGTVGYSVGNLLIEGYEQPWEDNSAPYSATFAKPLDILTEGSDGCSTYGNKFGEPVICGFTRSYGMKIDGTDRREYIKPILFSGGVGTLDHDYKDKTPPTKGLSVIKIGGPAYRIGVGGGSASSTEVQGDNNAELDFNAVQREDPEMEQRLNRLIRACLECSDGNNPILSIHDQGAGGNGQYLTFY